MKQVRTARVSGWVCAPVSACDVETQTQPLTRAVLTFMKTHPLTRAVLTFMNGFEISA
jgi:hypothetical protein